MIPNFRLPSIIFHIVTLQFFVSSLSAAVKPIIHSYTTNNIRYLRNMSQKDGGEKVEKIKLRKKNKNKTNTGYSSPRTSNQLELI